MSLHGLKKRTEEVGNSSMPLFYLEGKAIRLFLTLLMDLQVRFSWEQKLSLKYLLESKQDILQAKDLFQIALSCLLL